jgi:hypothetical protein
MRGKLKKSWETGLIVLISNALILPWFFDSNAHGIKYDHVADIPAFIYLGYSMLVFFAWLIAGVIYDIWKK